jgi:meso-butanediol dehydrogenase/(S,S)-butanediol dehydrogenase/diacetyl reductase
MLDFTHKRVLVTGGARGIGAATVMAFRAQGARVAVGARSHASFASFVARFEAADVLPAVGDLSDRTAAHGVVHAFFCAQAALSALENSSGNIVNVASDAGVVGYPLGSAYSAAKGGVVNLTRALAVELAGRIRVNCVCPGNVETDMIFQAAAHSGDAERYLANARARAPCKRMAKPQEVAAAILYLASREAAFTTGAALIVDGGGTAGF